MIGRDGLSDRPNPRAVFWRQPLPLAGRGNFIMSDWFITWPLSKLEHIPNWLEVQKRRRTAPSLQKRHRSLGKTLQYSDKANNSGQPKEALRARPQRLGQVCACALRVTAQLRWIGNYSV